MSYSTPLPEPSTETVQEAGDCVGSRLVSTLPICFREDTNHVSGGATLPVYGTTRQGSPCQCFSLRRSLAHLTPPKPPALSLSKGASPHRPDVLREKPLVCPLRERPLRGAPGYFEAYGTAPLRSGADQIFTGLVMYFSTHALNGRV